MTHPEVTILVPLRGECLFLSEALNSVRNQEYNGNIKVLVVNDGISSKSFHVLQNFQKTLSLSVIMNPNQGLVSALNFGIENSTSELIARLDGDDLMHPKRLHKQVEYLTNHPEVSVIGSQIQYIDPFGRVLGKSSYPCGVKDLCQSLPYNCNIAHPSVLYRQSSIRSVGGYRSFYTHAEDYDLWLRLMQVSRLDNLEDYLTDYRIHENQVSSKFRELQITASMAVNESFRRRALGLQDLSEMYQTPQHWRADAKNSAFSRRIHFFDARKSLWESRVSQDSLSKQFLISAKLASFPILLSKFLFYRLIRFFSNNLK